RARDLLQVAEQSLRLVEAVLLQVEHAEVAAGGEALGRALALAVGAQVEIDRRPQVVLALVRQRDRLDGARLGRGGRPGPPPAGGGGAAPAGRIPPGPPRPAEAPPPRRRPASAGPATRGRSPAPARSAPRRWRRSGTPAGCPSSGRPASASGWARSAPRA